MKKFTVIWGNIGDDAGKRLDHVEAEPNLQSVMDAAFDCYFSDLENSGYELDDKERARLRIEAYDGFAILDGHVTDSTLVSFG